MIVYNTFGTIRDLPPRHTARQCNVSNRGQTRRLGWSRTFRIEQPHALLSRNVINNTQPDQSGNQSGTPAATRKGQLARCQRYRYGSSGVPFPRDKARSLFIAATMPSNSPPSPPALAAGEIPRFGQ